MAVNQRQACWTTLNKGTKMNGNQGNKWKEKCRKQRNKKIKRDKTG
jgi:hypothetical protein